eukprot:scaffold2956_cov390-Prasinococcus_capsulatus_cf.AAC.3
MTMTRRHLRHAPRGSTTTHGLAAPVGVYTVLSSRCPSQRVPGGGEARGPRVAPPVWLTAACLAPRGEGLAPARRSPCRASPSSSARPSAPLGSTASGLLAAARAKGRCQHACRANGEVGHAPLCRATTHHCGVSLHYAVTRFTRARRLTQRPAKHGAVPAHRPR